MQHTLHRPALRDGHRTCNPSNGSRSITSEGTFMPEVPCQPFLPGSPRSGYTLPEARGTSATTSTWGGGNHVSGPLITAIALGTVFVVELPDNSGLAAAFAVHAALAVTAGSLLTLAPHKLVQIVVAAVFLGGAVLMLRVDNDDDDEARLKADATGFWPVAATSFGVILLAELGDPSDITMANLAARYHDPVAVGIGSVLGL